jgi:hypothetical protein
VIGAVGAVGRAWNVPDAITRAEPIRQYLIDAVHVIDPFASDPRRGTGPRRSPVRRPSDRHAPARAARRAVDDPHAVAVLVASPDQVHRVSPVVGRLLLLMSFVIVPAGLFFGIGMPWGGAGEVIGVTLAGGLFLADLSVAFVAIRRGEVARHGNG